MASAVIVDLIWKAEVAGRGVTPPIVYTILLYQSLSLSHNLKSQDISNTKSQDST